MRLHWISVSYRIWHVLQVEPPVLLAVYSQTENSVLCQIHVRFPVISLLVTGVEDHLKVFSLQQVLLEFLTMN